MFDQKTKAGYDKIWNTQEWSLRPLYFEHQASPAIRQWLIFHPGHCVVNLVLGALDTSAHFDKTILKFVLDNVASAFTLSGNFAFLQTTLQNNPICTMIAILHCYFPFWRQQISNNKKNNQFASMFIIINAF